MAKAKKLNIRIPLPKQVAKVHKDKKKYDRKSSLGNEDYQKSCPDCGEPIPSDTQEDAVCCNCSAPLILNTPQKNCPDCGEPTPPDIQDGDVCCNCGGPLMDSDEESVVGFDDEGTLYSDE